MKKCPYCAEEIQDNAAKCRYCGEWLGESSKAKSKNVIDNIIKPSKDVKEKGTLSVVKIIGIVIGFIFVFNLIQHLGSSGKTGEENEATKNLLVIENNKQDNLMPEQSKLDGLKNEKPKERKLTVEDLILLSLVEQLQSDLVEFDNAISNMVDAKCEEKEMNRHLDLIEASNGKISETSNSDETKKLKSYSLSQIVSIEKIAYLVKQYCQSEEYGVKELYLQDISGHKIEFQRLTQIIKLGLWYFQTVAKTENSMNFGLNNEEIKNFLQGKIKTLLSKHREEIESFTLESENREIRFYDMGYKIVEESLNEFRLLENEFLISLPINLQQDIKSREMEKVCEALFVNEIPDESYKVDFAWGCYHAYERGVFGDRLTEAERREQEQEQEVYDAAYTLGAKLGKSHSYYKGESYIQSECNGFLANVIGASPQYNLSVSFISGCIAGYKSAFGE